MKTSGQLERYSPTRQKSFLVWSSLMVYEVLPYEAERVRCGIPLVVRRGVGDGLCRLFFSGKPRVEASINKT